MRRFLLAGAFLLTATANAQTPRPKITGISSVRFHSDNLELSSKFYSGTLALAQNRDAAAGIDRYPIGPSQVIELKSGPAVAPSEIEEELALEVSNLREMSAFLNQHGYKDQHKQSGGGFWIIGPEGRKVAFVTRQSHAFAGPAGKDPLELRIIHVGFVVNDRAAAEKFFRDLLGFKLYWTGGPNWDGTEAHRAYMSYQVPDGHEWVEFMLNRPANMDAKGYGSANHVALGVTDIQKAREQLVKNGWTGTAEPRQGQDGKWQLNLFDPDGIRIELMEFTPKREPCCTPYQQPHPSPNDR